MQKDKLITLKLLDFNDLERNNLDAVLTLAERGLQEKWQIVDTETADFYLLSIHATLELETRETLKALPKQRCLYCAVHEDANNSHILVVNNHMCSLRALVTLFNHAAEEIDLEIPVVAVVEAATQAEDISLLKSEDTFFDVSEGFLGRLLESEEFLLKMSLKSQSDYPALYIDIHSNSYYSQNSLLALKSYLVATNEQLTVTPIIKKELETVVAIEKLKAQKIKDLVWFSVIENSAGRMIKGHSEDDVITLKAWPDLRLPSCIKYAKIATFMKNNAATLQIVAEKTGFSLAEVHTFYNACYMTGLIGHEIIPELRTKKIDSKTLRLFSKISARLDQ